MPGAVVPWAPHLLRAEAHGLGEGGDVGRQLGGRGAVGGGDDARHFRLRVADVAEEGAVAFAHERPFFRRDGHGGGLAGGGDAGSLQLGGGEECAAQLVDREVSIAECAVGVRVAAARWPTGDDAVHLDAAVARQRRADVVQCLSVEAGRHGCRVAGTAECGVVRHGVAALARVAGADVGDIDGLAAAGEGGAVACVGADGDDPVAGLLATVQRRHGRVEGVGHAVAAAEEDLLAAFDAGALGLQVAVGVHLLQQDGGVAPTVGLDIDPVLFGDPTDRFVRVAVDEDEDATRAGAVQVAHTHARGPDAVAARGEAAVACEVDEADDLSAGDPVHVDVARRLAFLDAGPGAFVAAVELRRHGIGVVRAQAELHRRVAGERIGAGVAGQPRRRVRVEGQVVGWVVVLVLRHVLGREVPVVWVEPGVEDGDHGRVAAAIEDRFIRRGGLGLVAAIGATGQGRCQEHEDDAHHAPSRIFSTSTTALTTVGHDWAMAVRTGQFGSAPGSLLPSQAPWSHVPQTDWRQ